MCALLAALHRTSQANTASALWTLQYSSNASLAPYTPSMRIREQATQVVKAVAHVAWQKAVAAAVTQLRLRCG
jgi:hypothetical protein